MRKLIILNYSAVLFFVTVFVFFAFFQSSRFQNQTEFFNYYLNSLLSFLKNGFGWLLLLFFIVLAIKLLKILISSVKNKEENSPFSSLKILIVSFFKNSLGFFKICLPALLCQFFLSLALGYFNFFNRLRLRDDSLLNLDYKIFHSYPFIFLHTINYPAWFLNSVIFSFGYLTILIIMIAIFIFLKNKLVFRELISAFILGLIFMFIFWWITPALSPHDRFLDNVYNLPVSEQISEKLNNFHPQTEIQNFLDNIRKHKENLKNLPTTTFPSAHAAWAMLFGYYLCRTKKILGIVILPILILSTFGTFFLNQHYFIDAPAGILVSIISIIFINWLKDSDKKMPVRGQ